MSEEVLRRNRPITELVRDASELPPEVTKFDSLVFTASLASATGILTAQVPLIRVPSDYDFSCYGLRGWVQNPGDQPSNLGLITFNVRESGRNQDIFATTDQQMASLVAPSGPANDLIFPERTLLRAGCELQARFTVAPGWIVSAGATKLVGFILFGQSIAKGIGRR
jgi:hypothetical protein